MGFLDYTSEDVDFDPSLVPIRQTTEDLTRRIRLATSEGLNIASELGDPSEDISSDSESSSDSDLPVIYLRILIRIRIFIQIQIRAY